MGIDEALVIAAWNPALEPGLFEMTARPIGPVLGHRGDGAIRGPGRGIGGPDLDDTADLCLLKAVGI